MRRAGKRARFTLQRADEAVVDLSGLSVAGEGRSNEFKLKIGGALAEAADGEVVPTGQNAWGAELAAFFNSGDEVLEYLWGMYVEQHALEACATREDYTLTIAPTGECLGEQIFTGQRAMLAGLDFSPAVKDVVRVMARLQGAGFEESIYQLPFGIVATKLEGVFYSFPMPLDPEIIPAWAAINEGLPEPLPGIGHFGVDLLAPAEYQYLVTNEAAADGGTGNVYVREGEGDWISVLTQAAAKAVAGVGAKSWLKLVLVDPTAPVGTMYVVMETQYDSIRLLKSPDRGANWELWYDFETGVYYTMSSCAIRGTDIYLTLPAGSFSLVRYDVRLSPAKNLIRYVDLGFSAWNPSLVVDPLDKSRCWTNGNGMNGPDLMMHTGFLEASQVLQDGANIGPGVDNQQVNAEVPNTQRVLKSLTLHRTVNDWGTMTSGPGMGKNVNFLWVDDETDAVLVGKTVGSSVPDPHTIFLTVDEGATLVGYAGSDPVGGYCSIPYTSGGIARNGVFVGRR